MVLVSRNPHRRSYLLVAALAMLCMRALTPDGYMPGSTDSGLLFELCPSGMPQEIMRALSGDGHHHHHHGDAGSGSAASAEQCPIGHMLSSAAAADSQPPASIAPHNVAYDLPAFAALVSVRAVAYRSRAPPG